MIPAREADASDHIAAVLDVGEELGNLLRRILQVGVDGDDDVTPRFLQPCDYRGMLAVVAVEDDADYPSSMPAAPHP